jgi:hypothetical protein
MSQKSIALDADVLYILESGVYHQLLIESEPEDKVRAKALCLRMARDYRLAYEGRFVNFDQASQGFLESGEFVRFLEREGVWIAAHNAAIRDLAGKALYYDRECTILLRTV